MEEPHSPRVGLVVEIDCMESTPRIMSRTQKYRKSN